MSANNIKINERSESGENEVPDETLSLPTEVYNANWRDDISEEVEDETKEVTDFEPFENEQEYKSQEIVSDDAEDLVRMFSRTRLRDNGKKLLKFVDSLERV